MSNREAIWKLVNLFKEYKKSLILILGSLLISSVLSLCLPLLSKQIMDYGFVGGNYNLLIKLVLLSTIIYIFNLFLDVIKEKKRIEISAQIQYNLSKQSFTHLLKLDISYFSKVNYSEIMNNIISDITKMSSVADSGIFFVVTQIFSIIGGIIGLFIIDYKMTLLVLAFIPFKFIVMRYFAKRQKSLMDEFILKGQKYSGWFGDTVGGINEVKLFDLFNKKCEEFDVFQKNVIDKQKEINMLNQWNNTIDLIMLELLSTVLYIVGANLVFNYHLSIGSIFAFIT